MSFTERAGEDGKLFGSVTAADVADKANAGLDFDLDKKTVLLEEPIKSVGTVNVGIRLHADVSLEIEVIVEPEDG